MIAEWIEGHRIVAVHLDRECTILMLDDGTQITIQGLVFVERQP